MSSSWPVLRRAVRGQARVVVGGAILLMSWQVCESLVPVVIGAIIDHAISPGDVRAIVSWTGILAALFLVLSLSFRFGSRLARLASERAAHEARVELAAVVLDPRTRPDRTRRTGTVLSVASSDTDRVGVFCEVVPRTCGALVSVAVAAIALVRISAPLGLLVLIGSPPLLLAIHALSRPLERRSGAEQSRAAEAASLATDLVSGLRAMKGIGGEPAASARYRAASRRSLHATLRAAGAESGYDATTLLLTMCFLALVALVGGRLATEGSISVGDLVAAVGLAQFLLGPLSQLAATGAILARAKASAARIAAVRAAPRHESGSGRLPERSPGGLTVHGPALDVTVEAGEIVGIAADPTTSAALVELLAAAPHADSELVRLDGVPLGTLDPAVGRGAYLVARHDTYLFAETVLDNIRATMPADDPRVPAAVTASDAHQVAETLPDGLGTVLTERGRSLSGGQRQRVALARALAAGPTVLVLHDPTTAVDAATEARIATGLRELRADHTTVIVATSPALLAACDRVLLVLDGRVRAEGTHGELTADPAYRDLVLG